MIIGRGGEGTASLQHYWRKQEILMLLKIEDKQHSINNLEGKEKMF